MSVHFKNKNKQPDSLYSKGSLLYLVEGNASVLLDGRRTPGVIEKIEVSSGMFIWRIMDFEDKGRFWELPFEDITKFQFLHDVQTNNIQVIEKYQSVIKKHQKEISIEVDIQEKQKSFEKISKIKTEILKWFEGNSLFFESNQSIDISQKNGYELLYIDLHRYMKKNNLDYLENETADRFCLNPNSGELIKGMTICLAEMGLVNYHGFSTRKRSTFKGNYSKEIRKRYLSHRLAFVQAMFEKAGFDELIVYRGMTSEMHFQTRLRPLLSTTTSLSTAKEFFDESNDKKIKSSYLMKLTLPVTQLLMTYLETEQFNKQYLEQEVIVLNSERLPF